MVAKRVALGLGLAGLVVSTLGGLAACETDELGLGPTLTLPDSSVEPFDAGATAPFDSGGADADDTDAGDDDADDAGDDDADDAGDADAGDAGDADAGDAGLDSLYTGALGSDGGTLYDDICPPGQLVIGVEGGASSYPFYTDVLTKLRFACGVPSLPDAGVTDVLVGAGSAVPADPADARGGTDAAAISQVLCPLHHVVVGIAGDTRPKNLPPVRDVVAQLRLRCAPLEYVGGVVSVGAVELAAGSIGPGGGQAAGPFDCGPGKVATGLRIQAGNIVDAVQVRCEAPVILP